jgi:enoyl-CoA hydratase/carnithine racemase
MNNRDVVTFEVIDSIGIISLSNPPANELSRPEFISLDLFNEWTSSPTLKGLIIKGEGKIFSAGGALDAIFKASSNPLVLAAMMDDGLTLLNAIQNLEIPVIAAINRVCFGGGLEIALACHIRVASENALLAFPEVNHNLMPGMGGTTRLPAFAGFSESVKMILGGDIVNATDAKALGLIDHIAPKDQAFEYAWTLMKKMTCERPVKVIRSIVKALKNATELPLHEAMIEETRLFCSLAKDEAERRKTEEA